MNMTMDQTITMREAPSTACTFICRCLEKFFDLLVRSLSLWLLFGLYCVAAVEETTVFIPVYFALGSPYDNSVVAVFRVFALALIFVPLTYDVRRDVVGASLIGANAILGFNWYLLTRTDRPLGLDILWSVAIGGLVLYHTAVAFRRSNLAWALTLAVGALSIARASVPDRATALTVVDSLAQMGWIVSVYAARWWRRPPPSPARIGRSVRVLIRSVVFVLLMVAASVPVASACAVLYRRSVRTSNFSGLDLCRHQPRDVFYPADIEELSRQVRSATHVRARGAGHSWNQLACTQPGGIVVDTRNLRKIATVETNVVRCQAGVTMGTAINFLMRRRLQLSTFWVSDVTIGGIMATNGHNDGISFADCCARAMTLMDARGQLFRVDRDANASLWAMAVGNAGLFGLIVDVDVVGHPLESYEYRRDRHVFATQIELASIIRDWLENYRNASCMWIGGGIAVTETRFVLAADVEPQLPGNVPTTVMTQSNFVNVNAVRRFGSSLWSAVVVLFPLISRWAMSGSDAEFEKYIEDRDRYELHWTNTPTLVVRDKQSRTFTVQTSVLFSTMDTLITIDVADAPACTFAVSRAPFYAPKMHVRRLPGRDDRLTVDFSYSTFLSGLSRGWIESVRRACPERGPTHPGKASIELLGNWSDTRLPTTQPLPPEFRTPSFAAMARRFDPSGKFVPAHEPVA